MQARSKLQIIGVFAFISSALYASANAQEKLDTGRTTFGTRVVRIIAPGARDTWEMNRIRDAEVDRLGQIWALEDTDLKIRVFSAEGRLLHTLGGTGSGPGEYRGFRWVQVLGDTMWVLDPRQPRLSAYSITSGTLLTSSTRNATNRSIFALSPIGSLMRSFSDENGSATETKPLVVSFAHAPSAGNPSVKLAEFVRRKPTYSSRLRESHLGRERRRRRTAHH